MKIKMPKTRKNSVALLSMLILLIATAISAQQFGVDETYSPILTSPTPGLGKGSVVQPDGKVIIYGDFTIVNGQYRTNLARLNDDGSVDPTLNCSACDFNVANALVQADGKILVAGNLNPGSTVPVMKRLNPDGSLDPTFTNSIVAPGYQQGILLGIAPDQKIYAYGYFGATFTSNKTVFRLNADGTIDQTFTAFLVREWRNREHLSGLKILPDGRVYIYGNTTYGSIALLNSDGSKNNSFEGPIISIPPGQGPIQEVFAYISSFEFQSDGKAVITGLFDTVNGLTKNYIARLNIDGSVDNTYAPPSFTAPGSIIRIDSGDKILVTKNEGPKKIVRLNSDGSLDNTYSAPNTLDQVVGWSVLPSGKLLLTTYNGTEYRFIRLNSDGSEDTAFTSPTFSKPGSATRLLVQSDGKAVVWGPFARVNSSSRAQFARLNADGTTDTSFDPGTGFTGGNSTVSVIAQQADGKLLVGGNFTLYNEVQSVRIVRLNADGTKDTSFTASVAATVNDIKMRPDGKILIGGAFTTVNSIARAGIALLNTDGSLDTSFNPTFSTVTINAISIQADGKVIVGGSFSGVNGFPRSNLARLNADGTTDSSFNAGTINTVTRIAPAAGGKIVILDGSVRRLNADGTADAGFTVPTFSSSPTLSALLVRADDSILVGGRFSTVNGNARTGVVRLRSNGTLDLKFNPKTATLADGSPAVVSGIGAQPNGRVIIVGDFVKLATLARTGLARITAAAVTDFDFDGDGRADPSVTRPGTDFWWYQLTGPSYNYSGGIFGQSGDKIVPADYDGDGKTDIAIWRPSDGYWWYRSSRDGLAYALRLGAPGDIPLPQDLDGDGKAEIVVVRNYGWYAATTDGQYFTPVNFGQAGDKPVVGDFDGDGKGDYAVFRPSTGKWIYRASGSSGAERSVTWGNSGDIPVPGDYDGDGKSDMAVFRPSEGNWYVLYSSTGSYLAIHFGIAEDRPIAADYDGDGKTDIAVFRPSEGFWYELLTTGGYTGYPWGTNGDVPTPAAYVSFASPPRSTVNQLRR